MKELNSVPERDGDYTDSLQQLPIIDLGKLLSQDMKGAELEKLGFACKEWGFFQLINHGVSMILVEDMKIGAEKLFNLSMEEKSKLWQKPGDMEGFGKMIEVPKDEPSDWVDEFYIFTLPSQLRKPHLFPNLPNPFRENLEAYCRKIRELSINIMVLMGKSLGIESDDIEESLGEGGQSIKLNYYPPCPQPDNVFGLKAHTDGCALTILFQNNDVEGLQINKDGTWISVKPLPNAFIVSLGDVMEVMTNGIYKSTRHRAIVNSEKERLSIATFYGPEWSGNIGPLSCLVTQETPPLFKTIGVADFYKGYLSPEHHGKSYINDVLRIQNEYIKD
ncbi:oxoglutarate-dependent flavonoid 7-O-demethylase 1-like [Vicia villosa]|uniref:oxoglutarate-dependent flavonoid 7-O-demethylase 1-like n=1 Tax=Vicia villosa TaxID=3911 RepID=UPI00273A941B|nr:oxoglutarate-dependent flavonoid 7-O-demethylase 1-like [Vicia villosa]XP_058728284.1 oxoglutarate-dependent flavonoid 7-O-demethylase 1-like [Vicia villosa]